jgi:cytochrome c553
MFFETTQNVTVSITMAMLSGRSKARRLLALLPLLAVGGVAEAATATPEQTEYFESKVRPLFETKCGACHSEQSKMAGLVLTTAEGFARGADTGPLLDPNSPGSGRLIEAVSYQGRVKMPPTGKLSDEEIGALKNWVKMGAPWPNAPVIEARDKHAGDKDAGPQWSQKKLDHWAFQPIRDPVPPAVNNRAWVKTPVDAFILARLEAEGLEPSPPADKLTLLRRAKFDLLGLPPTPVEIEQFAADESLDAYARLIDRLLESPRYGEKWGRHWLDVARYADSTGLDDDIKLPHTWKYRDYVIEAFNSDLPYDQFVIEQLAGDLMPAGKPGEINKRGIIATGFLAVGTKPLVQQDKVKLKYDVVDEQIDATSKAFLGLTIACARCHDHKFDPIATKDYYSMASIFASIQNFEDLDPKETVSKVHFEPLVPDETYAKYKGHQDKMRAVRQTIRSINDVTMLERILGTRASRLADYMVAAHEVYAQEADAEMVAARERLDCRILNIWADYLKPGGDLRLHLEDWHKADDASRRAVAEKYQQRYLARGEEWLGKLREWREQIEAWDGTGKFPERPDLEPSEDRFFSEVSLDADSMDEGAVRLDGPFAVAEGALEYLMPDSLRERVRSLREEAERLKKEAPAEPDMAYAVREAEPVEQFVFVRGNHESPGDPVAKQFPVILAGDDQEPVTNGSGRLDLARWIVSEDNPLPSRVMANRIWQWHFGQALVRTPSNFGLTGETPTHPELLDYLARQFLRGGWSIKKMHRQIMLSSTYQMSSQVSEGAWEKDPANRLWSRFERRRLTVEELRDALLALDGSLDFEMGGTLVEKLDSYGFENAYLHPDKTKRRTVYLPLYRNKMPSLLTLFDFADPSASAGERPHTNIAPQGLYFMNSEFVQQRARDLAKHLLELESADDGARVSRAYLLAFGRRATAAEVDGMLEYVGGYPVKGGAPEGNLERWQSLWRVLLTSNEFSYLN